MGIHLKKIARVVLYAALFAAIAFVASVFGKPRAEFSNAVPLLPPPNAFADIPGGGGGGDTDAS